MKTLGILFISSLIIVGCAGTQKENKTSHETEMVKIDHVDVVVKSPDTKKIEKTIVSKETVKLFEANPNNTSSLITCTSGSDTRKLEIVPIDTNACELKYTKNGETNTIANANFDVSYCKTVQQRVAQKLEAAGFNCQ